MEELKKSTNSLLLCITELIVGILLLIDPVSFTKGILIAAGIILMIKGLGKIIKYFKLSNEEAAKSKLLVSGLALLLAGLFCAIKNKWFAAAFPVLAIVYGIATLFLGLDKVQTMVNMIRGKNKKWFLAAIGAALSIISAVIILNNPFTTTAVLWIFTGVSLIVEAVFDLITWFASLRKKEETPEE